MRRIHQPRPTVNGRNGWEAETNVLVHFNNLRENAEIVDVMGDKINVPNRKCSDWMLSISVRRIIAIRFGGRYSRYSSRNEHSGAFHISQLIH